MKKRVSLLDKMSDRAKKISAVISAVAIIIGAITGVFSWVSSKFSAAVSAQISDFRNEVKASDDSQNQAITRLELLNLMQSDPYNTVAIEKLARYYFGELNGDQYMTGKYSDWAREYGGDTSIVIGVH